MCGASSLSDVSSLPIERVSCFLYEYAIRPIHMCKSAPQLLASAAGRSAVGVRGDHLLVVRLGLLGHVEPVVALGDVEPTVGLLVGPTRLESPF